MVMLLKIATLGLVGFIVLAEARPDFDGEVRPELRDDGIRTRRNDKLNIRGKLPFGGGHDQEHEGGGDAEDDGNQGAGRKPGGSKVVISMNNKQDGKAKCKCGDPKVEEFLHNFSLVLRAYTSKELVPELKKVAVKFVDYVLAYLAKEKPDEMAAVHNILKTSAQVTGNANSNASKRGGASGRAGGNL